MEYTIVHFPEACRFETTLDDGQKAYLDYNEVEVGLNMAHTYVPKAFEGRGIAAAIVRFALEYAKENDIPVVPSCSYVAAYIKRHPEYQHLVK
jgi:Predicted acetyltransferase